MSEKENQQGDSSLLVEAYELIENRWRYVSVGDLYKGLMYKLEEDYKGERNWIRVESKDAKRQLEVIHLVLLISKIEKTNLKKSARELQLLLPNKTNSIQPLYIPNNEEDDSDVLDIELDNGNHMIIKENSFLFKSPTEI